VHERRPKIPAAKFAKQQAVGATFLPTKTAGTRFRLPFRPTIPYFPGQTVLKPRVMKKLERIDKV